MERRAELDKIRFEREQAEYAARFATLPPGTTS